MSPDRYRTLTLLEVTGDAPVTAVARRPATLLQSLVSEGLVTTREGPNPIIGGTRMMMSITDAGLAALAEHRN
ncbi:hypothetical protein [Streptomyces sp. NPDC102264]|uniref:hypothetical protein n=1 Tax=Streptomyces sp. NPDC102264 TaxID=3366149 RepID=UPI003822BA6E